MSKHDPATQQKYKQKYGCGRGLTVQVRNNDLNGALRLLKRTMGTENVIKDLKASQSYLSKGEKKRQQKAASIRRRRKLDKKRNDL